MLRNKVFTLQQTTLQLGAHCDGRRLRIDQILQNSSIMKTHQRLQFSSFLWLYNYYRDLVPGFADVSKPLYAYLRQTTIEKTDKLEQIFEEIKRRLLKKPIIWLPDITLNNIFKTDVSAIRVSSGLMQWSDGIQLERPVAFFSGTLSRSELKYCAYEFEWF